LAPIEHTAILRDVSVARKPGDAVGLC
jgi:hypothetical protein